MVAIPTGIISAGFVDQYSRIKRVSEYAQEEDIHFIKVKLQAKDAWVGKEIRELRLPRGVIIAMIRRGRENIVPKGDVVIRAQAEAEYQERRRRKAEDRERLKQARLDEQRAWQMEENEKKAQKQGKKPEKKADTAPAEDTADSQEE